MKRHIYTIMTVVAVVALAALMMRMRRPFDWTPTFDPKSEEPFGSKLFDELMIHSLDQGYEVIDDIPDNLNPETSAVLYCKFEYRYPSGYNGLAKGEIERARKIMDFVNRGGKAIVAVSAIWGSSGADTLQTIYPTPGIDDELDTWSEELARNIRYIKREGMLFYDTLVWVSDGELFEVPSLVRSSVLLKDTTGASAPVLKNMNTRLYESHYAAEASGSNGGSITLVTMPLLFSNYAATHPELMRLTARLMGRVRDRHVVRIMGKNRGELAKGTSLRTRENHDSFSFLRQDPSLRWAFNITLVMVILMLTLGARRRFRAIPLAEKPSNVTLDFARSIGTYKHQHGSLGEVVADSFRELQQQLNEMIQDDVTRLSTKELSRLISEKSGVPIERVSALVSKVVRAQYLDEIDAKSMMSMIDEIREIRERL